ncbi:hypothetical protein LCGC14_0660240 [marine sediment metagenome]|uniref:DUF559 domain-containing protein n=1 Tax=marine sediment metagenome TaxID=412755 RepID=A0A0F9TF63_9ZZZZ
MTKSEIEELLAWQIKITGLPEPKREFRFHDTRKWRFDFSYLELKIAIEVHGGIWMKKSRHTSGVGFAKDCEKYSEAAILGWRIIHITTDMVKDGRGIALVKRALEASE